MSNIAQVNRDPRFRQIPDEVLNLILAVFVEQQFDELVEPLLGVLDQQPSRVAQVGVIRVQNVGGQQSAEIDDELLI